MFSAHLAGPSALTGDLLRCPRGNIEAGFGPRAFFPCSACCAGRGPQATQRPNGVFVLDGVDLRFRGMTGHLRHGPVTGPNSHPGTICRETPWTCLAMLTLTPVFSGLRRGFHSEHVSSGWVFALAAPGKKEAGCIADGGSRRQVSRPKRRPIFRRRIWGAT